MNKKKNISKEVAGFQQLDEQQTDINQKLDELISLLEQSDLDSESIKSIQNRFNTAIETTDIDKKEVKAFEKFDGMSETESREAMLDEFSIMLTNTRIDSQSSSKFIKKERASAFVLMAIGILMIGLGFAMIVMPAPPYFEMFTIYYFSADDGVTLMDVISLIIILAGVYLVIRSINRKNFIQANK